METEVRRNPNQFAYYLAKVTQKLGFYVIDSNLSSLLSGGRFQLRTGLQWNRNGGLSWVYGVDNGFGEDGK